MRNKQKRPEKCHDNMLIIVDAIIMYNDILSSYFRPAFETIPILLIVFDIYFYELTLCSPFS